MNTKEKIEVMQAYLDGKTIETEYMDGVWCNWNSSSEPSWCWLSSKYRIKKEPLVFYVNVTQDDVAGSLWQSGEEASLARGKGARTVKLVEEL